MNISAMPTFLINADHTNSLTPEVEKYIVTAFFNVYYNIHKLQFYNCMDKTIYRTQPCPNCGAFTNRGTSVDMIITKNDQILLLKRKAEPFKGYWGIFGGFIEWDESPEDAVRRETKEETNLDVIDMKLIGVYGDPKRHPRQVITIVYKIEVTGEPQAGDDAEEVKWFNKNNIPKNLGFDHNKIIDNFLHSAK